MSQPIFHINRRFAAPLHRLWQAFTTPEGLTAWMAPPQSQVNCLHLDPSVEGYFHYSLTSDAAEPFFGRWDFLSVAPFQRLEYTLAFSDEQGNCIRHPQAPDWPLKTLVQVNFVVEADATWLEVNARAATDSSSAEIEYFAAAMEQLALNWQEAFEALDEYFSALQAGNTKQDKITPCLWFNHNAETAVHFYCSLFPNSHIDRIQYNQGLRPDLAATPLVIEFTLCGQHLLAVNGGPDTPWSAAMSLMVDCADQAEVDTYWQALESGGTPHNCGWITDRFGVSWQIIPNSLRLLLQHANPQVVQQVFNAAVSMQKIDCTAVIAASHITQD